MKMLFIFNPASGKNQIKNNIADIIDIFVKGGYEVTVHPTQCKDDAKNKILNDAKNYNTIVVSGGDGTLSEAVNALMRLPKKNRPTIGYIPSGTTNDFASNFNIPKNNMKKAAINIVEGDIFDVDVGKFNNKYFSYISAFGAFTEVSYATNQNAKNILGYSAYLLEGIKSLSHIKPYRLKVKFSDRIIEDDFIFGMVSNSYSIGGMKYTNIKDILLNDGIFECVLIKNPVNPIDFQITIADLLTNNVKSDKYILLREPEITFECDEEIDWTLDGEYGGRYKEVKISNMKKAVRIITKCK